MRSEHFFYLLIFDSLPFAAILGGVHPESFKTDSELRTRRISGSSQRNSSTICLEKRAFQKLLMLLLEAFWKMRPYSGELRRTSKRSQTENRLCFASVCQQTPFTSKCRSPIIQTQVNPKIKLIEQTSHLSLSCLFSRVKPVRTSRRSSIRTYFQLSNLKKSQRGAQPDP